MVKCKYVYQVGNVGDLNGVLNDFNASAAVPFLKLFNRYLQKKNDIFVPLSDGLTMFKI